MLPSLFIDRLRVIFHGQSAVVLESFSVERLPSVRVNTLVTDVAQGVRALRDLGFDPVEVFSGVNAFLLRGRSKRDLTETDAYKNGWYYLQSLSSMVPVWSIEQEVRQKVSAQGGLQVLDMCAAPGSKTTQLAAVMEGKGDIVAVDVSRKRAYMLQANLQGQHVMNSTVHLGNASSIWRKYGPVFDVVLLDAPCSGEGRFSLTQQDSYTDWSLQKISRLSAEQRRLIFSAVMCLKSGGVLVYSTCTFAPEENELVVQYVLETFGGAITIESPKIQFSGPEAFLGGLSSWNSVVFDSRISQAIRIRPDSIWEGFFVCVIRRL